MIGQPNPSHNELRLEESRNERDQLARISYKVTILGPPTCSLGTFEFRPTTPVTQDIGHWQGPFFGHPLGTFFRDKVAAVRIVDDAVQRVACWDGSG